MGRIELVNGVVINFDGHSAIHEATELLKASVAELRAEYEDNPFLYAHRYGQQIDLFWKEWFNERPAHSDQRKPTRKTQTDR